MKLWARILIGMVLGVFTGLVLGDYALFLKQVGNLFIQLINMIIPLLILATMAVGITSIHDPKKMGRVSFLTLFYYLMTTLCAVVIGIGLTYFFAPGADLHLTITEVGAQAPPVAISEILYSIIPKNIFVALAENNVLQIIIFAIMLGLATNYAGEKGRPFLRFLESLSEVMYSLTGMIINLSPYGIFAIMAYVTGTMGFAVLIPLSKFLIILYLGFAIHIFGVFFSMIRFIGRVSPMAFMKGMTDAMMMAFTTCSSTATLPVTLNCLQDNIGVSKNIAGFMLPLGATVNMNGTALYQSAAAFFIAQAYGIPLSIEQVMIIVVSATLSAIGTAGIPGSGFIMLAAVVSAAGLPIEGIAILVGIDRIREMGATLLNVLGDGVCALCVARQEKEFDEEKFKQNLAIEAA